MNTMTTSTIAGFAEDLAFNNPNEVISSFTDEINVFNIKELNVRANLLAKGLLYNNVYKNTVVALVLAKTTNCLTFILALAKIGAILIPLKKDMGQREIESILKEENVHTIGFYADAFLKPFSLLVPKYTQNERGFLNTTNFPNLKNIVTFGSIKNRGMFTTRELMLLGTHMDDIEMENSIQGIKAKDTFIRKIVFDENDKKNIINISHESILKENPTFHDLQNYLLRGV